MKACYLDCFSGVSGDKVVAAFLDLGMPEEYLLEQLARLGLGSYDLGVDSVTVAGISATRLRVSVGDVHVVRTWASMRELFRSSMLAGPVRDRALAIFEELARAEAKVHAKPLDLVHFHEVGAVDTIVDAVGAAAALDFFAVERVYCSPVAVGRGMVRTEHGSLPVPAPATMELLRDAPVYSGDVTGELTTPTGAAILKACVDEFGDLPVMDVHGVGYGAGSREFAIPNVLRIVYGQAAGGPGSRAAWAGTAEAGTGGLNAAGAAWAAWPGAGESVAETDRVVVVETTVDNTSPQVLGAVFDMLLDAGALDVWTTAVQMKKQRPGTVVTVLTRPGQASELIRILLRETDTLGLRVREESRVVLPRTVERVRTSLGTVRVKVARLGERIASVMPEFDDVKRVAARRKVPVKKAFDRLKREAEKQLGLERDEG